MENHIYLRTGDYSVKISLTDILYVKAERKYIRIATASKIHFTRGSISHLQESLLDQNQFCRIHKSYIVSLSHITGFDRKTVFVGERKLPIGRHYKEDVQKQLFSLEMNIKKYPARFSSFVYSLLKKIEPGI